MSDQAFIARLQEVVGRRNLFVEPSRKERYCKGFRSGWGEAEAVVVHDVKRKQSTTNQEESL